MLKPWLLWHFIYTQPLTATETKSQFWSERQAKGAADLPVGREQGTSGWGTRLPGWFEDSEEQMCHSAPVNLPQPKPLLSWLTNVPISGANCGLAAKFKTWLFHVSAHPSAFSSQRFILNFRLWLIFSGKGLLEISSAAYLHGLNLQMLIFTDCTLTGWAEFPRAKRQVGQARTPIDS